MSSSRDDQPRPLLIAPEWVEAHCVVPDGFRRGEPFRLYEWQLLYLANFYLVRGDATWEPQRPVTGPAFVYRRALIVGPQKLGKDPLIATHVCVEGVGPALFAGWAGKDDGYTCASHGCRCGWEYAYRPGEPMGMPWPTPLIQITAFSEEQTANTYDALRPMIDLGPLADLIPKTGEEFIRLPGGGRIDTVTSSAQSRLGQRTTFISQGEVGIWTPQNKMTRLADTQYRGLGGMGGRASLNTNSWDPAENSVAQQQFESAATDIYRQFVQPPKTLSYGNKRDRAKIHRIVYPPDVLRENGGHLDLDAIENEAADLVERDLPQAARFYGNALMAGAGHAVDPEKWDLLARATGQPPKGTHIGIGGDGSISRDATVIRGCTGDGYSFLIGAWVKPIGSDMLIWRAEHPGQEWTVPRVEVRAKLAWAFAYFTVGKMLWDPPFWRTELEDWQQEYGLGTDGEPRVMPLDTNQAHRFAPAVDRWLTEIGEGSHTHDGDRTTTAHVKAAHKKRVHLAADPSDGRTKYVLVKGGDRQLIDGAVADVLSLEAARTMPPAPAPRDWGAFVA